MATGLQGDATQSQGSAAHKAVMCEHITIAADRETSDLKTSINHDQGINSPL